MKKNAYEDSTIKKTKKRLRYLQHHSLLADPEEIKLFVANLKKKNGEKASNSYKECLIETYNLYMKALDRKWDKPFYQRYEKPPKIPTEEIFNMAIAHATQKTALVLQMSKDLGTRPVELTWLIVKDIDLNTGVVSITGAKHTVGRNGKLKPYTIEMLKAYITKHKLQPNDKLLNVEPETLGDNFRRLRNKLAENLQNPIFKDLQLYDFRRFKATNEYHRTKDPFYVQTLLGHKDPRTTRRYIMLFETSEGDDFIVKVATNTNEAVKFVEAGFEYVTGTFEDGGKIFRKRK